MSRDPNTAADEASDIKTIVAEAFRRGYTERLETTEDKPKTPEETARDRAKAHNLIKNIAQHIRASDAGAGARAETEAERPTTPKTPDWASKLWPDTNKKTGTGR